MRNINKDYLVVVNTRTAKVTAPTMKFHVTDVLTCNIFFQLNFNDPNSRIVGLYEPEEHANNCQLTLRVAKPNGAKREILPESFELLDKANNLYVADLGTDFIDVVGFCECELLVKATITTGDGSKHDEIFTTEMFKYEVVKSVFSDLSDDVEDTPEWPSITELLATKEDVEYVVKNADKYGYATREYVNQVVIGGGIDLSEYVTDEELAHAIDNLPQYEEVDLSDYVTNQKLAEELAKVSSGGTIDLTGYVKNEDLEGYVTEQELEDALTGLSVGGGDPVDMSKYATKEELANKADKEHTHDGYITNEDLVAKNYATKSDIPTRLPANGGNADTVCNYGIRVCTQEEYDALTKIESNMLYFIKEDE